VQTKYIKILRGVLANGGCVSNPFSAIPTQKLETNLTLKLFQLIPTTI
jgi:hypothetical protein